MNIFEHSESTAAPRNSVEKFTRSQVLVKIPCISSTVCILKRKGGLWNARSLNGKGGGLAAPLAEHKLDFRFLTETWLKRQLDPVVPYILASVSGYSFYSQPRAQRRGGGVGIFTRSNLLFAGKVVHSYKSFECLELCLRANSELLRVVVIYRPPSAPSVKKSDILSEFSSVLEVRITQPGYLIVDGDLNFHLDNVNSMAKLLNVSFHMG